MPPLTGEQVVALVTLLVGAVSTAAGAVWQLFVKPREKRLTDLDKAQEEARRSREEFHDFIMAQLLQAREERDKSDGRADAAISSHAITSATLKELTGVVSDGNKSLTEEIRNLRATVELIQRHLFR